jgi:glycine dehydrogenase subunit 2
MIPGNQIGPGRSGLILEEPLLWERGAKGRCGMSIPESDVPQAQIDDSLLGEGPDFPDLSEVDVVRHYTHLSLWNFGVDTGMYPLGSCTMKYNPKINDQIAAMPGFAEAHPMLPDELCQGTLRLIYEMQQALCAISGLDAATLQPSAGAQGELTGMFIFAAYHKSKGNKKSKILMPDTAHGTNPASAALCGFKPVKIAVNKHGRLNPDEVRELMDDETAGIMITNPNTLGLFESHIREIADIVHEKGGLVYGDGANMNAMMGIIDMKKCGVDVMHWNVHKTLSTPHGGGGPGAGPVCVVKELEKFLPSPHITFDGKMYHRKTDLPDSLGRVHSFHGNFGVLVRAYSYVLSMGEEYLRRASELAVLNANYIKEKLRGYYYLAQDAVCMHEVVLSDKFQEEYKVSTLDIAKRLMDCGYHPPTIYFPLIVHGAIMIEPTETECLEDIDEFIEVMKAIAEEAKTDPDLLHNSPQRYKVRRLDETAAARNPRLTGDQ